MEICGLSEEEKKAVERVDKFIDDERLVNKKGEYIKPYEFGQAQRFVLKEDYEAIQIVLNLIEKQDTEINKLNNVIETLTEELLKD